MITSTMLTIAITVMTMVDTMTNHNPGYHGKAIIASATTTVGSDDHEHDNDCDKSVSFTQSIAKMIMSFFFASDCSHHKPLGRPALTVIMNHNARTITTISTVITRHDHDDDDGRWEV